MGLQIASELLDAGATVAGIDVKDRPEAMDDALYHQGDVTDDGFVRHRLSVRYYEEGSKQKWEETRTSHLVIP